MRTKTLMTAALAATALTSMAAAEIVVTQTPESGPVYTDHSIDFNEPGVPVGVPMDPFTFYQASDGISFGSGNGFTMVEDWDTLEGIAGGEGMGNQLAGGFSVRMMFDTPINEISWQGWADGNPAPPFGGINVILKRDGAELAFYSGVAAFGGIGDEWFNVTSSGDSEAFDEIVFFNGAFSSFTSYVDTISWSNPVPAPGAMALLGIAGLIGRRRRG